MATRRRANDSWPSIRPLTAPLSVPFRAAPHPKVLGGLQSTASNDSIASMATLTIRRLDEKTKTRLRVRAAHHGRSMEEEAREILRSALTVSSPTTGNFAEAIRLRFAAFGGLKLKLPRRDAMRHAPEFPE